MLPLTSANPMLLASGSGMIKLPQGGTEFTHAIFRDAIQQFPDVFKGISVEEDPKAFKRRFLKQRGDFFVRFEAARATAGQRGIEAAQWIRDQIVARQVYRSDKGAIPLDKHMEGHAAPYMIEDVEFRGNPATAAHTMTVPVRKHKREWAYRAGLPLSNHPANQYLYDLRGTELKQQVQTYLADKKINMASAVDLLWCASQQALDLSGKLFVVMGAGAETGPTQHLLAAGATVLWIDNRGPSPFLDLWNPGSSRLIYPKSGDGNTNLLTEPLRIAATIEQAVERYSGNGKAHFINVAYADGIACELTTAQDVITRKILDCVASLTLYISPTSPNEVDAADVRDPVGFHRIGDRYWAWSIVTLQGLLYLLAQYGVKRLGGIALAAEAKAPEVRLDVANIAEVESLKRQPMFALAFAGAPAISAETFDPATAAAIQAYQVMSDRLRTDRVPWNSLNLEDRIRQCTARQVHGNILTLGGPLESHITRAGLIGIKHRPELIPALVKSLSGRG